MMKFNIYTIVCILFLCSCKKDNPYLSPKGDSHQTILFYIAANNNLRYDALESFEKIKQGYKFNPNNKILIYIKTENNQSHSLTLQNNGVDTLHTFGNENSSDPIFFEKIISLSTSVYSSKLTGLILWSHATSWKPAPKTKSFGQDQSLEMDIKDLAKSLPNDLEFLVFDACTMASIEVLYELKDKAKYILSSPSEILSTSFPYKESINKLFLSVEGLKSVAQSFLAYYQNQNGLYQSATISLIQTSNLDAIAIETKKLLESISRINPYNISKVQQLTFDTSNNVVSYDFSSFLKNNYEYNAYSELDNAIQKAVLLKGNTKYFLGKEIAEYCGLTIYIPELNDPYSNYYKSLNWSKDSNWK